VVKQSKEQVERWYEKPDRWGYWSSEEDRVRKEQILSLLDTYETALDIGAGEGFITEDLPAKKIYAIEWSDTARARLNERIITDVPNAKFDLVVSTGTLYAQYDHEEMAELIKKYAGKHILISGIKDWLIDHDFGQKLKEIEFEYGQYTQRATLYLVA
jgi:hypothetical protein